ncbi:preprotein translocase subunit SecD [Thermococcus sp.]
MNRKLKRVLLNWKIILLMLFLIGSIASLYVRGLTFGIDISGGVAIIAQTEQPVSSKTMELVVDSLQKRLNTFGLRDISVEGQGNSIVVVKVANVTSGEEANQLKQVIESQGVFFMEFNGVVFGTGKDITYVGPYEIKPDNSWAVPFRISKAAAERFAKLARGKAGWPVDMFLDPPINSILVVPKDVFATMNGTAFNLGIPEAPPLAVRIEKALNITTIAYSNQSATDLKKLAGDRTLILVGTPRELYTQLREMGINAKYIPRDENVDTVTFVKKILGLYGPYSLGEGLANGVPQTDVQITGHAANKVEAEQEAKTVYTVLKSGSLPVKLKVISMEFISPKLGQDFKKQALYAGLAALIAVLLIVYFHYRNWKIAIPVASTSLFEVIIILGTAALIRWNLDLPSIAGIIAAIGTGVDQQVVITDELLGGGGSRKIARRAGTLRRIGRAFFIIFASASTTIAAMSFLLVYFVGTLKGFAVTTIIGVLIGIFITRPAYAEIAKYLIGEG